MISAADRVPRGRMEMLDAGEIGPKIERSMPLSPPGYGSAVLPKTASLELIKPAPLISKQPERLLIKQLDMGSAKIDLGSGYSVSVDDHDRMVVVENAILGSRTVIFGDGRIETPTGEPLQFWGTTSLTFGEDAKLTLQTKADPMNKGSYILDRLTLTNGNRAAIITGLGDNIEGKLKIKTAGGYATDERVRDGFTIGENNECIAWEGEYGDPLTQELMNATAVGGDYGPGSRRLSVAELRPLINLFLLSAFSIAESMFRTQSTLSAESFSRLQDALSDDNRDAERSSERNRLDRMIADQVRFQHSQIQRGIFLRP
jgi:hypothetical protein